DLLDDLGDQLVVRIRVDVEDDHGGREAPRVVAHADDLAVAHGPQHPVDAAHLGGAQVDRLDGALGVLEVHPVAHGDDVLEQHHDTGDDVLDDGLRADAGRQADHAEAGDDRGDVHVELGEDHHRGDRPDQHVGDVPGDVRQG